MNENTVSIREGRGVNTGGGCLTGGVEVSPPMQEWASLCAPQKGQNANDGAICAESKPCIQA